YGDVRQAEPPIKATRLGATSLAAGSWLDLHLQVRRGNNHREPASSERQRSETDDPRGRPSTHSCDRQDGAGVASVRRGPLDTGPALVSGGVVNNRCVRLAFYSARRAGQA